MTILIKNAERNDYNTLGDTLNPINDARRSTAIDRRTSNYTDAQEKVLIDFYM